MLDLDAAFARLRAREDQEAKEAQEKKNRISEAIRLAASECQRSIGGHGKVDVRRDAKGIILDAANHGWMTIKFNDVTNYIVRIGKKRSDAAPPEVDIPEYNINSESALGDVIAEWYSTLAISS